MFTFYLRIKLKLVVASVVLSLEFHNKMVDKTILQLNEKLITVLLKNGLRMLFKKFKISNFREIGTHEPNSSVLKRN